MCGIPSSVLILLVCCCVTFLDYAVCPTVQNVHTDSSTLVNVATECSYRNISPWQTVTKDGRHRNKDKLPIRDYLSKLFLPIVAEEDSHRNISTLPTVTRQGSLRNLSKWPRVARKGSHRNKITVPIITMDGSNRNISTLPIATRKDINRSISAEVRDGSLRRIITSINGTMEGSHRNLSTDKVLLSWTPWEVVNRATIDGQEIVFRVINGHAAKAGEFPYQVSLRQRVGVHYHSFCGGTVLRPKVIISAAHCFVTKKDFPGICRTVSRVKQQRLRGKYAVAGTLHAISHFHKQDTQEYGQFRLMSNVFYPTEYKFPISDICIVFLKRPFKWTKFVQPMPLASRRKEYKGNCMASGYGRIGPSERSTYLRKAMLRVINTGICDRIHRRKMAKFVCTSDEISNVAPGDSGGPLVCKGTGDPRDNSKGVLVGVTCGGLVNRRDGSYFTRVTSYQKFIRDALASNARRPGISLPLFVVSCVVSCSLCVMIVVNSYLRIVQ